MYAVAALAQLVVGRLIDRHALKPLYAGIVAVQAALIALASFVDGWAFYAVQFLFMAAILIVAIPVFVMTVKINRV